MKDDGCGSDAVRAVRTIYGTYRLCAECIRQEHLDIDAARGARVMSPATNPVPAGTRCECEHVAHDGVRT